MGVRSSAVEDVVDGGFWRGRRVLVTGHTGFKGGWLSLWLQSLGAELTGFSDAVPTEPSLYELAGVASGLRDLRGDVRDPAAVRKAVAGAEVVLHLAAQPLVRRSYEDPRETFDVNVMGTVNVLEAVRAEPGVRVVVNVTSDKCYENREWEWAYREDEPMGGKDPYSASKGAAELVTAAYRRSYFTTEDGTRLASARAGNVIGGGDWGQDRLLPDVVRATLAGTPVAIRNPHALRPWQHVMNPLSGYLVLAQALWTSPEFAGAWNFGPAEEDARPVRWILERLAARWPGELAWQEDPGPHPPEAHHLKIDSSRARARLGWRPGWSLDEGLDRLVDWYAALSAGEEPRAVTLGQIKAFVAAR